MLCRKEYITILSLYRPSDNIVMYSFVNVYDQIIGFEIPHESDTVTDSITLLLQQATIQMLDPHLYIACDWLQS